MDVVEFQKKLGGICELAKENENRLTQAQIRDYFEGIRLDTDQLLKVLKYLKLQGISIEGEEAAQKADMENAQAKEAQRKEWGTKTPLTPDEKAYLKEYLEALEKEPRGSEALEELFSRTAKGDSLAQAALTQYYLPVAARMAAEMNCEEIHLADLIQEANVGLLTALEETEPSVKNDVWMRMMIRKGIIGAIEEQTQRKFQDDCLVAKVEKLEEAVKELTEDDGETKFSVDELAVLLDMKVEEIKDILRLTGDDK